MGNNNTLLITFLFIFLLLGMVTPLLNKEFIGNSSAPDIENLVYNVGQDDYTDISGFEILKSMGTIFFWTFGSLPLWIDVFLFVPRIMFYVILYDKVRGIN